MKILNTIVAILVLLVLVAGLVFVINTNEDKLVKEEDVATEELNTEENNSIIVNDVNKKMKATIKTNKGDIVLELHGDKTPKTVGNFAKLATEGFYDGTKFHRVIDGFMVQGGDPLTKEDSMQMRWGTGGPGYQFEDEIVSGLSNVTGTISMANAGPNTNGSQFFINVADNTFLDGKHAVFGQVIEGFDLVVEISKVQKNERDVPVEAIVLEKVTVE